MKTITTIFTTVMILVSQLISAQSKSDKMYDAFANKDGISNFSFSKNMIDAVEKEVALQLEELPRKEIARQAISNSKLIYVQDDQAAIDLINEYGPEHYIVCVDNEDFYIHNTLNAGSVFIGNYTPESASVYASGTNHTLPTNGYAKQYSGVNLDSFMKSMTFQKITKVGIQNIGNAIELMAEAEGLQAHKNAVTLRLKYLKKLKI